MYSTISKKCYHFIVVHNITVLEKISYCAFRHAIPSKRPQFGQITQLLTSNRNYLLGWSDKDKESCGEGALKLGGHLECATELYIDLQLIYTNKRLSIYI